MATDEELNEALGGGRQLRGDNGDYKLDSRTQEDRTIQNGPYGECINDIVGGGYQLLKEEETTTNDLLKDEFKAYKNTPWYKNLSK